MSRLRPWLIVAGVVGAVLALGWLMYQMAWWQRGVVQVVLWQRDLYHALTEAISAIDRAPGVTTWSVLLGVSFAYGVFHAAGPGHGKVVLSTYLASQGGAWRRAIGLSVLASLLQGIVAIALVAVLVFGLGWLTRQAMASVDQAEMASFIMVALVGLWLCIRSLRRLWRAYRERREAPPTETAAAPAPPAFTIGGEPASSGPFQAFTPQGNQTNSVRLTPATHVHSADCGCGHDHHIDPTTASDWRVALLTVVSIGIRPCSGGVLLLGASALLGQFPKGVVAVLVMAMGTALTVSTLALLSVFARDWVRRRLKGASGSWPWQEWIGLAGGALILTFGLSLTLAQWQRPMAPTAPFMGAPTAESGGAAQGPFRRG